MTDIAARLDEIERAIANLPEWSEALADLGGLVAALRAVLAETDRIYDYGGMSHSCHGAIHTSAAAALVSA